MADQVTKPLKIDCTDLLDKHPRRDAVVAANPFDP
jgi:hypothetical protein